MKLRFTPSAIWLNPPIAKTQMSTKTWSLIGNNGSLTQQLRQRTNYQVQHHLLFANWRLITAYEQQALTIKNQERVWVRRVEWRYQQTLWVQGRVVFPKAIIDVSNNSILTLDKKPLGDLLFKDPTLRRGEFSFLRFRRKACYSDAVAIIWVRRSLLYLQDHPCLVTETFMPDSYA